MITNADESACREDVERVVDWCTNNDLELNAAKSKEIIIDFRKNKTAITPLIISKQQAKLVDSFKFLGTTIANTLKWGINAEPIAKKAQQRMFFLRQLKKFRVSNRSASIHNKNMVDGIVKTATKISGGKRPSVESRSFPGKFRSGVGRRWVGGVHFFVSVAFVPVLVV